MFPKPQLDSHSDVPLYRQLHAHVRDIIRSGRLTKGERLPATRELAGLLGLNRTTVSAAYELLEEEGLISGHVGRGSFVSGPEVHAGGGGVAWDQMLSRWELTTPVTGPASPDAISFATSRPSEEIFPLDEFRAACEEVLHQDNLGAILQLGSPAGYAPLRHYLLAEARRMGMARPGDDIVITNGCQQALDLAGRVLVRPGESVAVEDPVYPGLKNLFQQAGAHLIGVPVGPDGIDVAELDRVIAAHKPRLLVISSNFQNPTGATLPAGARREVLRLARAGGVVVVENDIYGELRYEGEPVPSLKELDESSDTVLLRSFSKITFPGLRVGWVIGPKPFMARLAEAKQSSDLHTDQLSQAVLLRFAESGRLAEHRVRVLAAGALRLRAVLSACERNLPAGSSFTRPQGGMNLWVRLPEPLDAADLLVRAQRENVSYLPGRFFEVGRRQPGSLRLSFAGLSPGKIESGLAVLGSVFAKEWERVRGYERFEPATAMV
jgi:2-aminoadipate transaminase